MSRDPAKSRPLSENVKRVMWLERAAPRNQNIVNARYSIDLSEYMGLLL